MKKKLGMIVLMVAYYVMPCVAQNTIPPKTNFTPPVVVHNITKVLSVTLSIDSTITPNNTATYVYLKVTFTSIGNGVVNYNLTDVVHNANGVNTSNTINTVTLSGTGTDIVYIKRSTYVRSSHSFTITTSTPNSITSNSI